MDISFHYYAVKSVALAAGYDEANVITSYSIHYTKLYEVALKQLFRAQGHGFHQAVHSFYVPGYRADTHYRETCPTILR